MNRKIIFDLSKEYPLFAQDEILCVLNAENIEYQIASCSEDALVLNATVSNREIHYLATRLSMSFSIGHLLFTTDKPASQIKYEARKHLLSTPGTIAVRYKNRSSILQSQPYIHAIAEVYTEAHPVDLTDPNTTIFLLITDEQIYVSEKIANINRSAFEKRKAHLRPFFSPISLHPKIARALVNIAQVKPGDIVLDPFCGTGGFLIEAALMNMQIIGCDVSESMINGTLQNLKSYQLKPKEMIAADIKNLPNQLHQSVDAVVTDFPYGKATSTQGEGLPSLYHRSMESIQQMLKPGGRAIVGTFSDHLKQVTFNKLDHHISYPLRVHKSLTRWFHVFNCRP